LHTRPASIAAIREAAQQLHANSAGPPPNIAAAEQQVREVPGARRSLVRPILKEPEFAARRRKAGRPRKIKRANGGTSNLGGMGEATNTAVPITSAEPGACAAAERP
jgi:hypothetical protein